MSYWHGDGLYVFGDDEGIHLWVYRKHYVPRDDYPEGPPALTDGKAARAATMLNGIQMPESMFEDFVVLATQRLRREGKLDQIEERLRKKYPED